MQEQLARFIAHGEGHFGTLALALYRWQRAHNPQYDRFCGGAQPSEWWQIPAVPVALFQDLRLSAAPTQGPSVVFATSGTSVGRRGRVHHADTHLYDLGARAHAQAICGPIPAVGVGLLARAPESSLAHMCAQFAPGLEFCGEQGGPVDPRRVRAALQACAAPSFVPGTAFAWADFVDAGGPPISLPPGSLAMVTGGFKGRRRVVSEAALIQGIQGLLPGVGLVTEYGMTELSSQLWSRPAGGPFVPPPWLRVQAVDPLSCVPTRGEGILRFFDLANLWTVLAIETQDLGRVDARGRVHLRGRMVGAAPRGCSLSIEEAHVRPR